MALEDSGNMMGVYLPGDPAAGPGEALSCEALLGRKIRIVSFYEAWGNGRRPDTAGIESCLRQGLVPMITWEPWLLREPGAGRPEEQPEYSLSAVAGGRHEAYLRAWALDLSGLSSPVFLRPMHEMNGNWYPWCGQVNGNRPEDYIAAWRYLRSVFREAGCDRVLWVWSPYAESVPAGADNGPERYFPGGQEVDWLALDGYNWGTTREWSRWRTFDEVFGEAYGRLEELDTGRPIMIAEAGCAEEGGDKGAWLRDAAGALKDRFPAVKALVWFNVNKECDWRIESSEGSLASFRTYFGSW